jgi:hypothetical protein
MAPALRLPASQTLARVLGRGLIVTLTCSEPCRLKAKLQLDAATAKRLGLVKPRTTICGGLSLVPPRSA